MARGSSIQPRVLRHLTEHEGQVIYRNDIGEDLGLTEVQVGSAVHKLLTNPDTCGQIEVVIRGRAWRYRSNTQNGVVVRKIDPKLGYHEIAFNKSGNLILQDDNGKVYEAKEL